jgi:transcriptional regulator with XRE-family HTH domain
VPASTADRPSLGEVDRHVAARLRRLRRELGLTQAGLAGLLGISAQQAHKYETRASLLPADRLAAVAAALGVGVEYFFEGLDREGAARPTPGQRRALELALLFGRLSGPQRETLCAMVRALAKEPAPAQAA